jgi:16S rRNA (cytidine1402-2'-O)-methyltransferase
MPGVIYLVATPIGNLEDITLRALRTLREVDLIACEDTRHTGRLLSHFEIEKPLVSYHDHNEAARAKELVERAQNGQSIAVVSDAGAPGISDPGFRVAKAAIEAGVQVVAIPGPSAAVTALTASGLPSDRFRFEGFLPPRKAKRRSALEALRPERSTVVLYESPHRIVDVLRDIAAIFGDRQLVVAREMTKLHEEFLRGSAEDLVAILESRPAVKGEFVLLISAADSAEPESDLPLEARVSELISDGIARMDAIKQAARERGMSKREAYQILESC